MTGLRARPTPPFLGRVPQNYDHQLWAQIMRSLVGKLADLQFPSLAQAGGQYYELGSLPTNANGLRPGTVYRDSDVLKITLDNTGYAPSFWEPLALGSVAVTT